MTEMNEFCQTQVSSLYHCSQRGTTVQLSFHYTDAWLLFLLESEKLEDSPAETALLIKKK